MKAEERKREVPARRPIAESNGSQAEERVRKKYGKRRDPFAISEVLLVESPTQKPSIDAVKKEAAGTSVAFQVEAEENAAFPLSRSDPLDPVKDPNRESVGIL